jgi:hypothetical protein
MGARVHRQAGVSEPALTSRRRAAVVVEEPVPSGAGRPARSTYTDRYRLRDGGPVDGQGRMALGPTLSRCRTSKHVVQRGGAIQCERGAPQHPAPSIRSPQAVDVVEAMSCRCATASSESAGAVHVPEANWRAANRRPCSGSGDSCFTARPRAEECGHSRTGAACPAPRPRARTGAGMARFPLINHCAAQADHDRDLVRSRSSSADGRRPSAARRRTCTRFRRVAEGRTC